MWLLLLPERQKQWLKWIGFAVGALALLVGILTLPLACTTTIVAPAHAPDPVNAFVLDHGRTTSLVVPTNDGRLVRYAYGEWRWYALRQRGTIRGLVALTVPTQATLGRQIIDAEPTPDAIRGSLRIRIDRVHVVPVARRRAEQLREQLDLIYQSNLRTEAVGEPGRLSFVQWEGRKYTYFNNSNHVTADWLERLGCEIRGPAYSARWRVVVHNRGRIRPSAAAASGSESRPGPR